MRKKNTTKAMVTAAIATFGFASACMAATPLTTVPWNGFSGAVSFTFDDALDNQITNLTPILEEMPNVRVTFFLSNMGSGKSLHRNGTGFAKLANMGNEIGNHTDNHLQLPDLSETELKSEIIDFATEIEQVMAENGAAVNVTALATPFCANNETVSSVINQRQFINRDGGWYGPLNWDVEPAWLKMKARIWNSASEEETLGLLNALDTAAYTENFKAPEYSGYQYTGPSWLVLLNHGVSNDGGMSIPPEDLKKAFERAIKNNMWVAPFSTVGAYYRSHFTLDSATAIASDNGYKVHWEMPHPYMPASIPLKVKLNEDFLTEVGLTRENTVLEQGGKVILPNEENQFAIEFATKELTIRKATAADSANSEGTSKLRNREARQVSIQDSRTTYTIFDMNGNRLGSTNGFTVPNSMPRGNYLIRAEAPGSSTSIKRIVK